MGLWVSFVLAAYTAASKLADGESGGKPRAVQGTLGFDFTRRISADALF